MFAGGKMAIRWEKLTVKSQQAMAQAQTRATELGNPEVQPAHLLLALVEDREGVIPAVLEKIGVPIERLEHELHQIEEKLPRVSGSNVRDRRAGPASLGRPGSKLRTCDAKCGTRIVK